MRTAWCKGRVVLSINTTTDDVVYVEGAIDLAEALAAVS